MFSKWLHGICYCLLVVVTATVASGQGLSVNSIPNSGLVQPLTPTSSGAAGAMSAACPAGQALTHITSTDYTCTPFEGGSGNVPNGTANQLLGWDTSGNPENQTIGGGNGSCVYTRTNLQYGSITCAGYVTLGGGQFTGTVGSPLFYMSSATGGLYSVAGSGVSAGGATVRSNSVAIPANGQYLIGDAPLNFSNLAGTATDAQIGPNYSGIGACTSGAFVTALQRNSTPICLTPAFAPLTNPTGGQNNYAPLYNPSFTGVVALNDAAGGMMGVSGAGIALGGSVLRPNSVNLPAGGQFLINDVPITGGGGGAPLVNPAGGQNNYAPIDTPTFTGSSFTLLAPSQGILFNSGGSTNTITSSITNQGVASNFLGMTAGVHYNGSTYILDATTPNGIVLNGQIGMYGGTGTIGSTWSPLSIGTFSNTGLAMGTNMNITTPTLQANTSVGIGQTPPAAGSGVSLGITNNYNGITASSIVNTNTGASASANYYAYNASHFGSFQMNGTGNGDDMVLTTSGTGGTTFNNSGGGPFDFLVNPSGLVAKIDPTGVNIPAGKNYQVNGTAIQYSGTWTPTIFGNTGGSATYSSQTGTYVVSQHMMHVSIGVVTATTTGNTGNITVGYLPVAAAAQGACAIVQWGGWSISSFSQVGGSIASGTTYITLIASGNGSTGSYINAAGMSATTNVFIATCDYQI